MNKIIGGGKAVSPRPINRLGWHANFCDYATMRVLIADDQKSVGTSLADLVRLCRHEVVEVVGSGVEAIQAYGRHHPDVVLMDYQMPKLNGATACRNIMAKYPEAPVILVSGAEREIGGARAPGLAFETAHFEWAVHPLTSPQPP